ncbi:hypothetical protein A2740_01870 [Candidatus Nomurabacteria bacterium RIFCSPHIGHO2_01_FULL_43_16]|nr:MAG: hypothetical protein A2740_01870 [Candidatus Nomurabacteria bacterium RIFCSPHIGHO2_01_FULL_43_16]OGI96967.1 MAG: hypothetical protein A3A11_00365 [Candidatus Nomurabacteria bacterium RIFCSPLOWO2_01_FULL_43_15]
MNLRKVSKSGFTLIELLVVVAIIGILASVVLASLNTARAKGANASIKANLANMRAQGEILYDSLSPNTYTGFCTNAIIANQLTAAANSLGGTVNSTLTTDGGATLVSCHLAANNLSWAVSSGLKVAESSNNYWCVDSTGVSKGEAAAILASVTACL